MAKWFGTPTVTVGRNDTPGLMPSEAECLEKITIVTQFGLGKRAQFDGYLLVHAFQAPVLQGQHVAVVGKIIW